MTGSRFPWKVGGITAASAVAACGLTALFTGLVFWISAEDFWRTGFYTNGWPLFLHNLRRFLLLVFLLIACRGAGLVFRLEGLSPLDRVLAETVAGFGLLTIIGFALGLLSLLTFWTGWIVLGLAAAAAGLLAADMKGLGCSASGLSWVETGLSVVICVLFLYFIASRGLLPSNGMMNDYSHYFPYYEHVRTAHTTSPTSQFFASFYLKGHGLAHLAIAVSDVTAAQLVGLAALILLSLLLLRIALIASNGSVVVALLAAAAPLAVGGVYATEFEKTHIVVSMLIMFYLLKISLPLVMAKRPPVLSGAAVKATLAATVIISPVAIPFLLCLMAGETAAKLMRREPADIADALSNGLWLQAVLAPLLVLNYLGSGLPEVTPIGLYLKFADPGRLSEWTSETAIRLQLLALDATTENDQRFSDLAFARWMTPQSAGLLLLLVGLPLAAVVPAVRDRLAPFGRWLSLAVPSAMLLSMTYLLFELFAGRRRDLERFALYEVGLWVALGLALLGVAAALWTRRRTARAGGHATAFAGVDPRLFALALGPLMVLQIQAMGAYRTDVWRLRSVAGSTSLAEQYVGQYDAACVEAGRMLSPGTKVQALMLQPFCALIPGIEIETGGYSRIGQQAEIAYFGPPEAAAEAYRRAGLRHFILHMGRTYFNTPGPTTFAPLFSPESLARHFRLRGLPGGAVLLTLDGTDRDGEIPSASFLDAYRTLRARLADSNTGHAYRAMEQARKGTP